jgi:AcrR family transcriptional regulator
MTRKRLTREESRDQTRQRLLDAAQKLIAQQGLTGTSVEDIAEAAGYTRGAFYSNFASKRDLFIELLRRDHEQSNDRMAALLDSDLAVDQLQARAREMYGQLYQDNECFMNWTEARLLAVRDAKFRAKLTALTTEKRGRVAEFIAYFYQRVGTSPPSPPEAMAMGFMSLVEGVKLIMLSSPQEMTPPMAETVLTLFIDSIMQLARLQAGIPDTP